MVSATAIATTTTNATSVSSYAPAASGSALLSAMCGSKRPFAATLHHHAMDGSVHTATADPTQKRSPLLCGYPSKKCWAWRVEKRNGELHKFCEYHRQKANTNQRRMEQRRKNGRTSQKDSSNSNSSGVGSDSDAAKSKSADIKQESQPSTISSAKTSIVKTEAPVAIATLSTPVKSAPPSINTAMANAEKAATDAAASSNVAKKQHAHNSSAAPAASPRGVEHFDSISPPLFSWAEVDLDIGMDAAVEYMMIDHAIDSEPSDKPVDLYEEDLYFLEHFIAEIAATGV